MITRTGMNRTITLTVLIKRFWESPERKVIAIENTSTVTAKLVGKCTAMGWRCKPSNLRLEGAIGSVKGIKADFGAPQAGHLSPSFLSSMI
jgi:hypothetical protein